MEQFLESLKQAAIFMVAAKVILHFFPGNKYERYGKMMAALIVLSMLAVPVLSFFTKDMGESFWEKADRLEAENDMFSKKLERLSEGQESIMENSVLMSVEEKLGTQAQEAGVAVRDVHISDGTVVIEVEEDAAENPGKAGKVAPVDIERVDLGKNAEETAGYAGAGSSVIDDAAAQADAGAVKGRRRADLARIFAAELGMEEGEVEVIEHR